MKHSAEHEAQRLISQKIALEPKPRECLPMPLKKRRIHSLGSLRSYIACAKDLIRVLRCVMTLQNDGSPRKAKTATAQELLIALECIADGCSAKTLEQYRRTAEFLFNLPAPKLQPGIELAHRSRAYRGAELLPILKCCSERVGLSVMICFTAGLRASELCELRPADIQPRSNHRIWLPDRFCGLKEIEIWTVKGKGKLVREIPIFTELAEELRRRQFSEPRDVVDRDIRRQLGYDIAHGHSLSTSFTIASKKALGMTFGLHGLRHTYAQRRQIQLRLLGFDQHKVDLLVSQELGHFRPSITNAYYS